MNASKYRTLSGKMKWLYIAAFFAISIPLFEIVAHLADYMSHTAHLNRGWIFLITVPLVCGACALGVMVIKILDKKMGAHCPHCGRSLTSGCDSRKVASSGQCPGCEKSVFDAAGQGTAAS